MAVSRRDGNKLLLQAQGALGRGRMSRRRGASLSSRRCRRRRMVEYERGVVRVDNWRRDDKGGEMGGTTEDGRVSGCRPGARLFGSSSMKKPGTQKPEIRAGGCRQTRRVPVPVPVPVRVRVRVQADNLGGNGNHASTWGTNCRGCRLASIRGVWFWCLMFGVPSSCRQSELEVA